MPDTPAQKAGKLYTTAMSSMRTRQWDQAGVLLDRFVGVYPTHEYVPVAYLQLAYCRYQLKDLDSYQAALNAVISRFYASPAWFCAYGSQLGQAKTLRDHDQYLTLLENLVRQAKEAPRDLHGSISRAFGHYSHDEYSSQGRAFEPVAGRMGSITRIPGWVMDWVRVADTPERAGRALSVLAATLQTRGQELPTDWQFAHVLLLRKAGKTDQASRQLQEYLEQWGRDPRAIDLWLLHAQDAESRKDAPAAGEIYRRLRETHGGSGSLEAPFRDRLSHLYHQDEYEKFTELALHYLKTYTTSRWFDHIVGLWVGMAKRKAEKDDASRIAGALKMLEDIAATKHPLRRRSNLIRKIELHVLAKRPDKAAELAMGLIGEKQWSAESFQFISRYARSDQAFTRVVDAARKKYGILLPNPASKAFVLLNQLKVRLKDDQVRHAEEIGEEIFAKHREDASAIEAIKLLADYYFKKVLPEPRDKWMVRMIQTYPHHPLTQQVLANQITAERAARRYDRLAAALETMAERFPPVAATWGWYVNRQSCYDAEKDADGKVALVRRFYGDRADAGEIEALDEIVRTEHARLGGDNRAAGDDWTARAKRAAGDRLELHCLARAWGAYYWGPYYHRRQIDRVCWAEAKRVTQALQRQKLDPALRWKMAFADINLMAHKGEGKAALEAINERIPPDETYRDLSLRLDFAAIGAALGKQRLLKEGVNLARRLKKRCPTRRDAGGIELMLASMHATAKNHAAAAEHYLNIVASCPWPIRRYAFFRSAAGQLRQARSPAYAPAMEAYMRRISRVQEKVPEVMYELGYSYLGAGNRGAFRVLESLASRYPASAARERLAMEIARRAKR